MNYQPKKALILSGGGSKGAFQIGVLESLLQKHTFDLICGTSVGAINGWMISQNKLQELKKFWLNIRKRSDILKINYQSAFKLFSKEPLSIFNLNIIKDLMNSVGEKFIPQTGLIVGATNLETGEYTEADQDNPDLFDFVIASASVPIVFPPVKINGSTYVDGGLRNNTPLMAAIKTGADEIHVVLNDKMYTQRTGSYTSIIDVTIRSYEIMVDNLLRKDVKLCLDRNRLPQYRVIVLKIYEPEEQLGSFLDFSGNAIHKAIEMGLRVGNS